MNSSKRKFMMGGIAVALAGVLTVGGIATRLHFVEVQASPSLDGIEEIISNNSAEKPFKILEIVPSATVTVSEPAAAGGQFKLSTGTVGWLISGNEPMRPELTLQQLQDSDKRKDFVNNKLKKMLYDTRLIEGTSGALNWVGDYQEITYEQWAALPDDQKQDYGKFSADGAQLVNDITMTPSAGAGDYVMRYMNPSVTGSANTIASDFFDKNDVTNLSKVTTDPKTGYFDPNFILDSRAESGTGLYFVEFAPSAVANVKRGAFHVSQEKEYTINTGEAWGDLSLAENTIMYEKDANGRFSVAGYLCNVGGNISVNALPDYTPYSYTTADAKDEIFVEMKRHAAENPTAPEYGEEEPAGDPESTSENNTVSEGEAPGDPTEPTEPAPPEEDENNPDPEEPTGEARTLYTVVFEYTESIIGDSEQLYYVSDYKRMADDTDPGKRGVPYKINSSEPLVSNYSGQGIVTVLAAQNSPWLCFEKTEYGNFTFSAGGGHSYYLKGTDIYYKGGFTNNDWFKRWVFDLDRNTEDMEARENMSIQVYTVSAASVTISDIENADLVYLSEGNRGLVANKGFMPEYAGLTVPAYTADSLDITKEVTTTLLYQASMRNLPVMTDYELVKKDDTATRATYAWKAAYILAAADVKAAYNKYVSSFKTDGIIQMSDRDHTWVNKNIYIFNDFVEENAGHTILNYNFIEDKYDQSYVDDGLQEVKKKIEDTNSKRSSQRKITNTRIYEATIIRHILDYGRVGTMASKDNIHVLELEPTHMGITGQDEHWGTSNVSLQYDLSVTEEEVGNTKYSTLWYCKHDQFPDSTKPGNHTKRELIKTTGTITLTQMGTQEYVGKIDDLNSTYDLIFIGDDSTGLNHQRNNDATSGTKFNDATMNGLVYFNVGDYSYVTRDRAMGAFASEYKNGVVTHWKSDLVNESNYKADDEEGGPVGRLRYSGNDIRNSDITYFYNFAKADYPILVGDNLLTQDRKVNEDYVDNTSHLCEMLEKLLKDEGTEDNLFRIGDLMDDTSEANTKRNKFKESLGILKPEIVFIDPDLSLGDKWEVKTGSTIDGTDKNFIDVKFRIDDPGSGSDYAAKAYIDLNADGKYATNEMIGGGAIRIYDSGSSGAVDREHLHSGTEYRIVCELNDAPVGIYPWKLIVAQNGNEYRRDGQVAYFLAPTGRRDRINVLQLKSAKGTHNGSYSNDQSLDLQERMSKSNSILGKYLKEVRDFDLNIIAEYSDSVINGTSTKVRVEDADHNGRIDDADYLALFDQYDMLILGFGDMFTWGSRDDRANEAAEALLQYIALGKSVLFCHDASSYFNYKDSEFGYEINQYIRSIVGMNRYGVKTMAEELAKVDEDEPPADGIPGLWALLKYQKADTIWEPRSRDKNGKKKSISDNEAHGACYHGMIRYGLFNDSGKPESNWKMSQEDWDNYNDSLTNDRVLKYARLAGRTKSDYTTVSIGGEGSTTMVDVLNRGQITEYPYELPDSMPVKVTHAQYWQLNLDLDDDDDGETDVVVWYTMGNTTGSGNRKYVYSGVGRDGRNNYFIYNKGNVVYSGQGHVNFITNSYDDISNTDINSNSTYESKLIVNTIIASYAAGTRAAKVHFHETGNYNSRSIISDIIPYDAFYNQDTLDWEKDTAPLTASTNTPGVYEGATKTTYFEIDDTNVVDTKKIYAKFYKEENAALQNSHARTEPGTLHVKEVVALSDDGEDVSATYGAITADPATGEYLLYDSTNTNHLNAPNAGKMYKLVYYLDSFDVDSTNMATVTNTPGVRVVMREAVQKRKGGSVATSYSDDILALIRTRMFDLK